MEPKLKLSKIKSFKRERYWAKHEKPLFKRSTVPGMQRRLYRHTILDRVSYLGRLSDVAVLKTAREEDLIRNRAFAIYQQRLWGALDRLKKQNPFLLRIPPKLEREAQASAMKAQLGEKRK